MVVNKKLGDCLILVAERETVRETILMAIQQSILGSLFKVIIEWSLMLSMERQEFQMILQI